MSIRLSDGVFWVGAFDWKLKNFHGVATPRGGTYNAYLIIDDEVSVIDTVYLPFFDEFLRHVSEHTEPSAIKHIIVNHAEPDHASSLKELLDVAKGADIVCTSKCKDFLTHMGVSGRFTVVKDGDILSTGSKRMKFIEAPMLHWPEVMWTFLEGEGILFPCDMYGTQVIESDMKAEAVPDIESFARRYFAFIFRPLAPIVLKGIEKTKELSPKMICPSHGPVWRDAMRIVSLYEKMATRPDREKVLILYSSIWKDVERMAHAIAEGVQSTGVEVVLRDSGDLDWAGWSDLLADAMESRGIAIGSLTVLGGPFPQLMYATMLLRLVRTKGKAGLSFGAYGWGPGITKKLDEELKAIDATPIREGIEVRFTPTDADLKRCYDAGVELGERVKGVKL
ncbi:MAG: FprA family A-type flavoprotein [Candidatus Methanomethylicia archaeon]|nr:FprA family A-type flavoprotein [Candidatus Methanomethylicia archaeon]